MERIKTLPVPEARESLICDCKGTPFWQTDKTFTQLFSKQYASLIFTHYIYILRARLESLRFFSYINILRDLPSSACLIGFDARCPMYVLPKPQRDLYKTKSATKSCANKDFTLIHLWLKNQACITISFLLLKFYYICSCCTSSLNKERRKHHH